MRKNSAMITVIPINGSFPNFTCNLMVFLPPYLQELIVDFDTFEHFKSFWTLVETTNSTSTKFNVWALSMNIFLSSTVQIF